MIFDYALFYTFTCNTGTHAACPMPILVQWYQWWAMYLAWETDMARTFCLTPPMETVFMSISTASLTEYELRTIIFI